MDSSQDESRYKANLLEGGSVPHKFAKLLIVSLEMSVLEGLLVLIRMSIVQIMKTY